MITPIQEQVRADDGVVLVTDIYPHDAREASIVILLHGAGQNRHAWATSARRLALAGYSVVAYDARGHGDSDWDPGGAYEMDRLGADLLTVADFFTQSRRPIVVGASMGGMAILSTYHLTSTQPWASVVLLDVTPRLTLDGVHRVMSFMGAHPEGFESLEEAAAIIAEFNPHRARRDRVDGLHKVLRRSYGGRWVWRWDPAFARSKLEPMTAEPDQGLDRLHDMAQRLLDNARRITVPTLIVRGALSDLVSPEAVAEFRQAVPHAEAVDVGGAGHMVAGDDNDTFTTAVIDFLDRTSDDRRGLK